MTDQIQDQEVELDENNDVVEAHDPKNAETDSIATVDKAADATVKATPPKTKAGMVNAMAGKMAKMNKTQLKASYESMMGESADLDDEIISDYKEDLDALIGEEEGLAEGFKDKAATIFEAAVNVKVQEEIALHEKAFNTVLEEKVAELDESYETQLEEGLNQTREALVEKIDSYLNYVVETWMDENRLAVEKGLRTEIAETFMSNLKDLFSESYIEVPEGKVDLVDDLVEQVETLEAELNSSTEKNIAQNEEVNSLRKTMIIREASKDLAETQVEKLLSLADNVDYEGEDDFAAKVETLKGSYFSEKVEDAIEASSITEDTINEINEDPAEETQEVSSMMEKYLTAIRSSN
jgi:hypothetical protein